MSPDEVAVLQTVFQWVEAPCEAILFGQGEICENLFVVVKGEIVVRYKPEDGPDLIVARVREQGVVGWSALLGSPFYTSSAVCLDDCVLLRARSEDLRRFIIRYPDAGNCLLDRLAWLIAERVRNSHTHIVRMIEHGLGVAGHSQMSSGSLVL